MKRRSILSITGALVATVAITGSAFAATTINNGSFETGNYVRHPDFDLEQLSTGSDHLEGWTVTGSVDWTGSGIWNASEGTKSIDLEGAEGATGAISQTIATTSGSTYVVTFDMSGNSYQHQGLKTMTVSATGGTTSSYSVNTTGGDQTLPLSLTWVPQTYEFVASSSSTTLTFASTGSTGYGPALDKIVVTEKVIETVKTGADCKKGGWQTMVDSVGNPFKNQGDCVSFYATGGKNLAAK